MITPPSRRSGASLKDRSTTTTAPITRFVRMPVRRSPLGRVGGHCARPVAVTGRSSPPPEGRPPRPPHDFDAIYAVGTPAWDIGRPQPTFDHLATAGELVGRVLDVGCGTGEHALIAASLGYEAVGGRHVDAGHRAGQDEGDRTGRGGASSSSQMPFASLIWVSSSTPCSTAGSSTSSMTASASAMSPAWLKWSLRVVAITCSAAGWEIESIESAVIDLTWDPAGALAWQVAATRR